MRPSLPSVLVAVVAAVVLVSACSKPAEPGASAPSGNAPAAAAASEAGPVGPSAETSVPMAVAHASDAAPQHGVPPAGDASMPSEPIAQPAGGTSIVEVWANRQALAGKSGVYDVKVSNQEGRAIALFRGKSIRVAGEVISG